MEGRGRMDEEGWKEDERRKMKKGKKEEEGWKRKGGRKMKGGR